MIPARTAEARRNQGKKGIIKLGSAVEYLINFMPTDPYLRPNYLEAYNILNLLIMDIAETEIDATQPKFEEVLDNLDRKS